MCIPCTQVDRRTYLHTDMGRELNVFSSLLYVFDKKKNVCKYSATLLLCVL